MEVSFNGRVGEILTTLFYSFIESGTTVQKKNAKVVTINNLPHKDFQVGGSMWTTIQFPKYKYWIEKFRY